MLLMFIKIEGYGTQTTAGTVPFATYEYFEEKGIDLEEYDESMQAYDSNQNSLNIPKEHNFILERGSCLYDVNDLWELQGAILDKDNTLVVEDDDGSEWECDLSLATLQSYGINLVTVSNINDILDKLSSPTAIAINIQGLKGLIFGDNGIESDSGFDPKKLEIHYHDHDSELIVVAIHYAKQELSNMWIDVETKFSEYKWLVV